MTMTHYAANVDEITCEDILDSRDLIALRETVQEWLDDEDRDPDEYDEDDARAIVAAVQDFEDAGASDWRYGAVFIADSYFEAYTEQTAEDIGAIDSTARWPLNHIDWTEAADALKDDYLSVTVNGVEYWTHA